MSDQIELQQIIGQVAAAYFNNNHVTPSEIALVIGSIATSIAAAGSAPPAVAEPPPATEPEPSKLTPQQIRRSITQDKLISFEDGKGYKTLRRHLAAKGLTPDDYRNKWGLPKDYPMASPAYSETRSRMAKVRGFGSRPAATEPASPALAPAAPATATPAATAERVRGRPPKIAKASNSKAPARRRTVNSKKQSTSEPNT